MATSKTKDHKTPNGGVRSQIIFLNDDSEVVDETEATACEILEYDEAGKVIHRTYGIISRSAKMED